MTTDFEKAYEIFFPYSVEKTEQARFSNLRFVHYTRAASAAQIIKSKSFWFRKSSSMNDSSEVRHGQQCLLDAWKKSSFPQTIDALFPNFTKTLYLSLSEGFSKLATNTYIASFSEHCREDDQYGRLSMWRAYGYGTGVALVMNNAPFLAPSKLDVHTSPVAYLDNDEVLQHLNAISKNIEKNASLIASLQRSEILNLVYGAFKFGAMSIKHPGFREEQEWRLIYSPPVSRYMEQSIETINGVPQKVFKIPLRDIPAANFYGASIPSLIERIIIGPTQYPEEIKEAFVELLSAADVPEAEDKVFTSNIPLRF